jgi:hypothetical protein
MYPNNPGYIHTKSEATSVLQAHIRANFISGDKENEERLERYMLNWNFYRNKHWAKDNEKYLSFNYIRAFIDKSNNFLAGKHGFETNVYDMYGEEVPDTLEKAIEMLIEYNWKRNKKGTKVQDILQMGGVTGDCWVFLSVDRTNTSIRYTVLDSRTVIPMFLNGDTAQLEGYLVVQPVGWNEKEYLQKCSEYRKGTVRTYYKKSSARDAEKFEVVNMENDLPFIPIVHIKNAPSADSWYGTSDCNDLLKINKIYNEMAEDVKDIVDYYATPTTVITGATMGTLKRGINNIWSGLPADANVFNLSLNEDLAASMNFLQLLKQNMHELSGIPENVLGKTQHVSNTSASALHILYQPLIEAADRKWLSYGDGFEEINRMTMYMFCEAFPEHELVKDGVDKGILDRYVATPAFTYGLPTDRLLQLTEAEIELRMKIGSRREVMERLGKKNIPMLETQIIEDVEFDIAYMPEKEGAKTGPGTASGAMETDSKSPLKVNLPRGANDNVRP